MIVIMLALYALPVLYISYFLYSAYRVHRDTKVPGPWYTNYTSLVLKYNEFQRNRRLWIHSLHQKYGPVVRLAPNEVSFTSLEAVKEIYQSGGSGYDKTEFYDLFKQFDHRTMFSTLNRHDHADRKKLFADRYAMTNVVRPDILNGIAIRASSVVKKCESSIGRYLDIYVVLHCYALDCASHFLFSPGGLDTINNPEDHLLMQELSYHDSLRQSLVEYYSPFLSKAWSFFSPEPEPQSRSYVLRRAHGKGANETSLIARLQSKSSLLTNVQMAAECMDHMAAGIDTTGDALCFLMHELSLPRSAHIQSLLREELLSQPNARLESVEEFPYLDALIKEGLRIFPPIPMSFPRYVPAQGRTVAGHDLPAGTIVSCQPYSLHLLNESVWGPYDPALFKPERWLEADAERRLDMNRLFFSFGGGGRGCIGRNLAMMEMKTLLREIYTRFTTAVAPEMRDDMSIDDQIIASRPKDQTCLLNFYPVSS